MSFDDITEIENVFLDIIARYDKNKDNKKNTDKKD